jgi:hypothetical protein
MKNQILCGLTALLCLSACKKSSDTAAPNPPSITTPAAPTPVSPYTKFTIRSGQHYCDGNQFRQVEIGTMSFTVKFDSSAIYTSVNPENQYDINKLLGFSDNNTDHHRYSARYGWRWSGGALRLFAYVYNNGAVISKELATVAIGAEVACSITVTSSSYLFTTNGITERLPRMSVTPKGKGYQLYPYFGGDETAPHDVNIYIKGL